MWQAPPYYKGHKFCPNPIVKYGIPKYADSLMNKKVIGTPDWQKFWEEQLYYIHNGYDTGGIHLPGRFYYFMNYRKLPTVLGPMYPMMCDLHLELANVIEYAKANRKHIITPKGRRKGISEFTHAAVVDYGYRFKFDYKAGVAAGLDDYVQDFMAKWRYADSLIVPEFRMNKLLDNKDEVISGWDEKVDGAFIESGSRNTIYARTMFNNANLFKGLYLNDIIAEECGEFSKLKAFVNASQDCLRHGSLQVGNFFLYGTGNKMDKGSKDFKDIWDQSDKLNFIRFFIDARRFYTPYFGYKGAIEIEGVKEYSQIPNLIATGEHTISQLEGVEDLVAAEAFVKKELERLATAGDPKAYHEFRQNNPLKVADVFRTSVINCFNSEKLAAQVDKVSLLEVPKYIKYRLEFEKNAEGMIKMPMKVNAIPLKTGESEDECVYILASEHPRIATHKNLYVAGIDSYDQDTSKTSKSLGAMSVRIKPNNIPHALKRAPVAVIRTRPPRKEKFYELCLKLAVYYDIKHDCLIDVRCPGIIQYWKDRGGEQYLAKRPAKFESENSEQGHDYGVSLNNYSKPLMVSLMQTEVEDGIENMWFDSNLETGPNMLTEYQNYDEVAIGSDNDLADADGMALMQLVSTDVKAKSLEQELDRRFDMPYITQGGGEETEPQDWETEGDIPLFR